MPFFGFTVKYFPHFCFMVVSATFILMLDLLEEYTVPQIKTAVSTLVEAGATVQYDSIKMILGNKIYEYQCDANNEIEQACEAQLRKYGEVGA